MTELSVFSLEATAHEGPRGGAVTTNQLLIVGAGGHAVSVTETALAAGYEVVGYVSTHSPSASLLGRPVHPEVPTTYAQSPGFIFVAVGDNFTRQELFKGIRDVVGEARLPALVHPSASVSRLASVGPGTAVMQQAVVGSDAAVARGCLVNSGSVVEHECRLADFSSTAPLSALGGRVEIGSRSAIGIGAVVKHGITIGADVIVGAAAYVHSDLPARVVAFGTPARVQRQREPGDPYLT